MSVEAKPVVSASSDRKVAIGAVAAGMSNIVRVLLQLVLLPVMARLLGPDEFGLYALAFPTISLLSLLADAGLGNTLMREPESSTVVWSTAFWILQAMGILLACGATLVGFLLGHLAHQPRLPGLVAFLSLSMIFLTLPVVPSARLMRRKQLTLVAGIDLASAIIGAIFALVLALSGAGVWSLATQYLATYAVRAVILNLFAFQLPGLVFDLNAIRPHLVSGGILIASRMCEYAGRAVENIFVDRIFGTALLGAYNLATQVSKFATDTAANAVWGVLYVQASTEEKSRVILLHRQLCRLLGVTLFPATFLAAAAAPELTSWLLGPKWPDIPFLFRFFLPLYALSAIAAQTGPLLLAFGRFDIQFWCMLGLSMGRVLAVALGFWIGLTGAVYAIAVVTVLYCAAMMVFPARVTGCNPGLVLAGLIRPAIASIVATLTFLAANKAYPDNIGWTLSCLTGALIVYGACMLLIDRKGLSGDWSSARRIMSRGGESKYSA